MSWQYVWVELEVKRDLKNRNLRFCVFFSGVHHQTTWAIEGTFNEILRLGTKALSGISEKSIIRENFKWNPHILYIITRPNDIIMIIRVLDH